MAQTIETGNIATGTSASNFNHTVSSNSRRVVVICAGIEGEQILTSLGYGSASLGSGVETIATIIETAGAGNTQGLYCVLDSDIGASGSKTVSASGPAGTYDLTVVELWDTEQVVPSGANVDTSSVGNGNTSVTSTATAQADSMMVSTTGHGSSGSAMTPSGTGTWSTLSERAGSSERFANRYQQFTASAGSKTLTETWGSGTRAAQVLASFAEDTGSGGGTLGAQSKRALFIGGMNFGFLPPLLAGFLRKATKSGLWLPPSGLTVARQRLAL